MTRHDNLINGQWVAGNGYSPNLNPSNLAEVIGEYTQGDAAHVDAAVAAARAAFGGWSVSGIQASRRCARQDRHRNPGAQGRAGNAAGSRGRQDEARRHRRSRPRRRYLQILRR